MIEWLIFAGLCYLAAICMTIQRTELWLVIWLVGMTSSLEITLIAGEREAAQAQARKLPPHIQWIPTMGLSVPSTPLPNACLRMTDQGTVEATACR